nr:unnamed protein product [Meloidogyne enterolobii]
MGLYQEGNLLVKTDVDKEGNYNFVTRPGDYVISPFSAPKLCLNQGTVKITVGSVPVTVNPDFRVDGYNLVVNVKDKEGNPFPTSTVLLSSDNEINFTKPQMGAEYPFSQNVGHKWFYRWLTDNLGSATIVCLPSGNYIIDAENFLNNVKAIFGQKIIEMNSNNEVNISVISFDVFGTATDNHYYKNALYKYEVNSGSKASNNESNNVTTSMVDFSTVLSVVLAFVALFIMCIFTFFQIYICLSDKMNSARIESNDNYHRLDDKMTTNNHLIIGMRENNNEMRNHINNGNQQLSEQINNNHQQLSQENQQLRTDMNNNHQQLMNVFNQLNNTVITNKTVLENKTKFIDSKVDAVSDVVRKMKVENNLR